MYILAVVLDNDVHNGLVIDLKKVDQEVMTTVAKKVDMEVVNDLNQVKKIVAVKKVMVTNDLGHHAQKEMDLGKENYFFL
jgi:hypothetical protein